MSVDIYKHNYCYGSEIHDNRKLSSNEDLGTFSKAHPLYPQKLITTYTIVKDLFQKKDMIDLELIDGKLHNYDGYLIHGTTRQTKAKRLMIPWSMDCEVDLNW